jgi:hypothetical protein
MKYAMLIMAHKNGKQLARLVHRLRDSDMVIFIHLDTKFKNWKEEITSDIQTEVVFTSQRFDAALASWPLVQAEIELIKEAKIYEKLNSTHFDYYLLLSGQDYPIKSIPYIKSYLEQVYPKPLIDMTPYDERTYVASFFGRFRFYHINNYLDTRFAVKRTIRRALKAPLRASEYIATKLLGSPKQKITKYTLAAGSAWWILPDLVIDYTRAQVEENNESIRCFRHVKTPEESFFQTMTANSPLKNLIEWNDLFEREQNCLTYAFFTDSYNGRSVQYPFTGHPYIFRKEDFYWVVKFPHFFVRKVDVDVDDDFCNLVDAYVDKHKDIPAIPVHGKVYDVYTTIPRK